MLRKGIQVFAVNLVLVYFMREIASLYGIVFGTGFLIIISFCFVAGILVGVLVINPPTPLPHDDETKKDT